MAQAGVRVCIVGDPGIARVFNGCATFKACLMDGTCDTLLKRSSSTNDMRAGHGSAGGRVRIVDDPGPVPEDFLPKPSVHAAAPTTEHTAQR